MNSEALIERFHDLAGLDPSTPKDADSLIGFFQTLRPDGVGIADLFDHLDFADALQKRLAALYQVAGDDRRPQGGRDAYFVVRRPPPLAPEQASSLGDRWLEGLRDLAVAVGDSETAVSLDRKPVIRILEGIAPKHPKIESEKSPLLLTLQQDAPLLVQRLDAGPLAPVLRPAYYFAACDTMLRDYLMWPFYQSAAGLDDPLEPYFQLWRHGVKYRVFADDQVDLYLPRQSD